MGFSLNLGRIDSLQHQPSPCDRPSVWRALVALGLCAWVLICSTVALSPTWHEHLHHLSGDASQSEAGCAIDLFATGGVDQALTAGFVAAVVVLGTVVPVLGTPVSNFFSLQSEHAAPTRGPPVPAPFRHRD